MTHELTGLQLPYSGERVPLQLPFSGEFVIEVHGIASATAHLTESAISHVLIKLKNPNEEQHRTGAVLETH